LVEKKRSNLEGILKLKTGQREIADHDEFVRRVFQPATLERLLKYATFHWNPATRNAIEHDFNSELYEKIANFVEVHNQEQSRVSAHLSQVLHNFAIDLLRKRLRKKRRAVQYPLDQKGTEIIAHLSVTGLEPRTPLNSNETERLAKIVHEHIEHLSARQKEVMHHYYVQRHTLAKIAELLGISAGTVKTHFLEAKENLKASLETDRRIISKDKREGQKPARNDIAHALMQLRHDERHVLDHIDLQGMGYDQYAEFKKMPVGSVRSRLFRARNRLAKIFEEHRTKIPDITAFKRYRSDKLEKLRAEK